MMENPDAVRDAFGAEIETPKASRGRFLQPTRGLGSGLKLPQQGPGTGGHRK